MITFENFLLEYKKEDIDLLDKLDDYFTIGFEIELDSAKVKESWPLYPSRMNRVLFNDFEKSFPVLSQKYKDRISLHYDETVPRGIEIVNSTFNMDIYPQTTPKPFSNVRESINYINDFFNDYNKQNNWIFDKRTSIHINIGIKQNKDWNVVKGIMMLSDEYAFKGVEDRKTSDYCKSLKEKLEAFLIRYFKNPLHYWKKEIVLNSEETSVKKIEDGIVNILLKRGSLINKGLDRTYGINLSNILTEEENRYIEFRHLGGSDMNREMILEKIKYFCYVTYLMTSDYRKNEYIRKLFGFINKCKNEN
jgi:hypothetical protein